MDKLITILTIFTVSITIVMAWAEQDQRKTQTCPRCGVVYEINISTSAKRRKRGAPEYQLNWCADCKPRSLRKGRMTGQEIWEAYLKDMGIK